MLKTALVTARAVLFCPQDKLPLFEKKAMHSISFRTFSKKGALLPAFFKKQDVQKLSFRTFATPFSLHLLEKRCPKPFNRNCVSGSLTV